ncbi:hypothetical protein AALB39_10260 [Lachnospiraceae bacterium 54-53]
MMKKICPVCDLPVNEWNYCPRCRRVVRNPLLWKSDYYLNDKPPATEKESGPGRMAGAGEQQKNVPQVPREPVRPVRPSRRKAEKNILASVGGIIAFILFVSANVVPTAIELVKKELAIDLPGDYEAAFPYEDSGYAEFEEEEIKAAGERCTGYDHFPADGKQIADSMWEYLNRTDYGYQVEYGDVYSDNYEFREEGGPISYYETVESFSLEDAISASMDPADENYIYQYVDINYDTATGELHDYVSSLRNKEASLDFLEEFLRLTEAAAGIAGEESSIPGIMEQARAGILQESGAYILDGLFDISIYQEEEGVRIYVSYNNPQVTENQET